MKLVLGLGNPGRRYEGTRHNVGFDVIVALASRYQLRAPREKHRSLVQSWGIGDDGALLMRPLTFMNLSGLAALSARDFFRTRAEEILVVCDDLNLPLGRLRMRSDGSAGGQKGLADIIRRLGSDQIPRLRIGIGTPPERWDSADYVLGRFDKQEKAEMELAVERASQTVTDWVKHGTEYCMNRYNQWPPA